MNQMQWEQVDANMQAKQPQNSHKIAMKYP